MKKAGTLIGEPIHSGFTPDSATRFGQEKKGSKAHIYMYVEMAHYTDDDTVALICVTNQDDFQVHEIKLEKIKDNNWKYIIERFCSGNSSD